MPLLERLRTESVVAGTFVHEPGESAAVVEWWQQSCVALTTFGSWEVRSGRGGGVVDPRVALVGQACAEYDCRHPDGVDDRMLVVGYRVEVDPGPRLLVPLGATLQRLRRSLIAELRTNEPDQDRVDTLCQALLERAREAPGPPGPVSARTGLLVARIRAEADVRYTDLDLDLVAEAAALGMSRTRLVHAFREVVGVTPHRYVVGLRTTHAARLLAETRAPVAEVCFDSGFGSMSRFHAAFYAAFGTTPTGYRSRYC